MKPRIPDGENEEVSQGVNLRRVLPDREVEVYRTPDDLVRCHGRGLCGTCVRPPLTLVVLLPQLPRPVLRGRLRGQHEDAGSGRQVSEGRPQSCEESHQREPRPRAQPSPSWTTIVAKNLSKLPQFIARPGG